jgi:predicted phage tail protein
MLTTIKVYGSLAKFLGQRVFRAAVDTPLEAVSFLRANFEGLAAHMAGYDYKILTGTLELQAGSNPEQLQYPAGEGEAISIVPVIGGAGGGSTTSILAGAALIGASFLFPGAGLFGTTSFFGASAATAGVAGTLTTVGTALSAIGAGLVLNGVSQMLTPTPETPGSALDPASNPLSFSGIQNVSRQGVAVPVVYGETLVGSVVISSGINTQDD